MRLSFWEKDTWFSSVDFVVVGSGIVGLNAALSLKKALPESKVLVLERGVLPTGASSKNAGFACFGSLTELEYDLKNAGEATTLELVEKRWKGLKLLRETVGDENLEFRSWNGFELFTDNNRFQEFREKLGFWNQKLSPLFKEAVFEEDKDAINRFGFRNVTGIIRNNFEGQINTGKMISALHRKAVSEGILVLTGIEVKALQDTGSQVEIHLEKDFSFSAARVIIATNGFARQLLPDLLVDPARAQVLVTRPIKGLRIKGVFHYDEGYYYFRNIGERVLFGGGRNLDFREETTYSLEVTEKIQNRLDELLKTTILPDTPFEVEQRWAGIMGVGPIKKPVIKNVSKNIICSVRMGGMGVAIGSLVGLEGAEMAMKS